MSSVTTATATTAVPPSKKPSTLTLDRVWLYAILLLFAFFVFDAHLCDGHQLHQTA
jgi:hypothetical protein